MLSQPKALLNCAFVPIALKGSEIFYLVRIAAIGINLARDLSARSDENLVDMDKTCLHVATCSFNGVFQFWPKLWTFARGQQNLLPREQGG